MRVADVAKEAGLDIDETLVLLWDAGLDRFANGTTLVRTAELDRARQAVGLAGVRQLVHRDYWEHQLVLEGADFDQLMVKLGIHQRPQARRLPKGAIRKLRRWAKREGKLPEPTAQVATRPLESAPRTAPYKWSRIGRHNRTRTLAPEDLARIHQQLVEDFRADDDPIEPPGVRSPDLLASAAFRPDTALGKQVKYATAEMATAALVHAVVHNHPFFNGNKRTALVALLVQLDLSNLTLTCTQAELFRFILRVAQHRIVSLGRDLADREVAWIAEWICANVREVDKSERPLRWRRLRRLLADFDCEVRPAPGVGHRVNVIRTIRTGTGFLGRPKVRTLRTQVQSAGDGTDADRSTIKKIRGDLELDDDHGIDSLVFYQASQEQIAEGFIVTYRKTLKRLAQL